MDEATRADEARAWALAHRDSLLADLDAVPSELVVCAVVPERVREVARQAGLPCPDAATAAHCAHAAAAWARGALAKDGSLALGVDESVRTLLARAVDAPLDIEDTQSRTHGAPQDLARSLGAGRDGMARGSDMAPRR